MYLDKAGLLDKWTLEYIKRELLHKEIRINYEVVTCTLCQESTTLGSDDTAR